MNKLTNVNNLGLAIAVWLAHDTYNDGSSQFPEKNVISATSLLKPTRQLVLTNRIPLQERSVDVADMIPSRLGHAIHDSIEQAWRTGYRESMRRLGYPQKIIDWVRINPQDHELKDGILPVYLEQRYFREISIDDYPVIISGQFDQIIDGEINDIKSTSVYVYMNRSKEDDYRLQGSIYRWINPEKVTSDIMRIHYVFTDWQRVKARTDPNYPQQRVVELKIKLLSLQETESRIRNKIKEIIANQDLPEPEIIRCSDKDLWKTDPIYKYYSDPAKAAEGGRATKNFPNYPAAAMHCSRMGKGVVITVPGQVKACGYCPAFAICTQKDEYNHEQGHD